MPSTPEEKKKVLTRVRRIRGQIDALERALENGAECRAILQQIAAVRGASNGLMAEVLESHIRETSVVQPKQISALYTTTTNAVISSGAIISLSCAVHTALSFLIQ